MDSFIGQRDQTHVIISNVANRSAQAAAAAGCQKDANHRPVPLCPLQGQWCQNLLACLHTSMTHLPPNRVPHH